MRKTTFLLATILVVAVLAFAQDKPTPAPADPVIMKAGELEIKQSEFEAALQTIPAEYQAYASGAGKRAFAEDFLRMKLLAREAEKHGLDKSPEVVRQLKLMRENALANAELERIEKTVQISEAELQKAYEDKTNEFEQVKARHILIAFKGSPAAQAGKKELTEDEAKAKAEEIRKKLVGGADFAELAKAESDDRGSAARGGELGTFSKGQMVPEFDKAAFETKPGEISPAIRTQYGYHVIKVEEHKTVPLAEVKPQLEREVRQKKMQERLEQMKQATAVTFNDTYFAPPPAAPTPPAQSQAPATPPSKP